MNPLNFSASLRACLTSWVNPPDDKDAVIEWLDNSVKFILPEEPLGAFPRNSTPYDKIWDSVGKNLPYPIMALERIVEGLPSVILVADYPTEIFCWVFFSDPQWGAAVAFMVDKPIGELIRPRLHAKFLDEDDGMGDKRWELAHACWDTVLEVCILLACKNVYTREVKPSFTEKRVAAKRKRRIFTYHVLEVGDTFTTGQRRGPQGGRDSPRVHLRRGHVRHLSDKHGGGITWVNATVVGSKTGMVHKDYGVVSHAR